MTSNAVERFQCRRCRYILFTREDLADDHNAIARCSLWYLRDDDILPWILKFIDESGWTQGKLYCPRCEARIGAFDFLHMVACECGGNEMIPAIYCVKSKVDHMKSFSNVNKLTTDDNDQHQNDQSGNDTGDSDAEHTLPRTENSQANDGDAEHTLPHTANDGDAEQELNALWQERNLSFKSKDCEHMVHLCVRPIQILSATKDDECMNAKQVGRECTSTFKNESFDATVSDSEDQIIDLTRTTLSEHRQAFTKLSDRKRFDSLRLNPPALRCSCCRTWFDKLSSRQKMAADVKCDCLTSSGVYNEFVNISYDGSSHTESIQPKQCCYWERPGNHIAPTDNRTGIPDSQPSNYSSLSPRHMIHEDLLEMQHELRNLQSIIQREEEPLEERRTRRRRRRRRRNEQEMSEIASLLNTVNTQSNAASRNHPVQFENIDIDLPDRFQCPICLDILYDPHTTICNHVYCSPCLRQLNKVSRKKPLCPLCRQKIYSVEHCSELQDDLKRLHPESYRKRSRVELRRTTNSFPLPSSLNVRFEEEGNEQAGRFVNFLYAMRTCLIIIVMLVTYLLNGEERHEHRRYARVFRWFFYGLIALTLGVCGGIVAILFAFCAYDFIKFLIGLCLFYAIVTRLLVAFI